MSPTIRKQLSAASSEHNTHILRSGMPGLPASTVLAPLRENKISQNGIDKKPGISAFCQYHSGCVFYYRRIAGKQKQAGTVARVA